MLWTLEKGHRRAGKLLHHAVYELLAKPLADSPYFGIWSIIQMFPARQRIGLGTPAKQLAPRLGNPGGKMHPVCHIAHMVLIGKIAWPQRSEHPLAHLPVKLAYTIHPLRELRRKVAHRELLLGVVRIYTPKAHESLPANTVTRGIMGHVGPHEILWEPIMPCWNWRVGGEYRLRP